MSADIDNTIILPGRLGHPALERFTPLAWFVASLRRTVSRRQQRRALARLDDRLLADIGITREQARAECAKPRWQD